MENQFVDRYGGNKLPNRPSYSCEIIDIINQRLSKFDVQMSENNKFIDHCVLHVYREADRSKNIQVEKRDRELLGQLPDDKRPDVLSEKSTVGKIFSNETKQELKIVCKRESADKKKMQKADIKIKAHLKEAFRLSGKKIDEAAMDKLFQDITGELSKFGKANVQKILQDKFNHDHVNQGLSRTG